jgi:hypothetical protein
MDLFEVHNFLLFPGFWVLVLLSFDIAHNGLLDPHKLTRFDRFSARTQIAI